MTLGSGYRPELDGVRAIAVTAVMMYHFSYIRSGYRFEGGFLGVDIFFVLSGYLITTLLLQEIDATNVVRLGYFYARRALRLLPALLLAVVFAGAVTLTLAKPINARPFWQSALYALSYVGNWADAHLRLGLLGHTWSLAIEEQYYLIWPLALVTLLRLLRSRWRMAALTALGAVGVALVRFVLYTHGYSHEAALWTIARADGVLIGSALALVLMQRPVWLTRLLERVELGVVAGVALAASSFFVRWNSPVLYRGGLLIFNLVAAVFIGHLAVRPSAVLARVLSVRPLPSIGRISYELYLFHVPMLYLVAGNPKKHTGWLPFAVALGGSVLAAVISYRVVDRPLVRVRKRFTPPRATTLGGDVIPEAAV